MSRSTPTVPTARRFAPRKLLESVLDKFKKTWRHGNCAWLGICHLRSTAVELESQSNISGTTTMVQNSGDLIEKGSKWEDIESMKIRSTKREAYLSLERAIIDHLRDHLTRMQGFPTRISTRPILSKARKIQYLGPRDAGGLLRRFGPGGNSYWSTPTLKGVSHVAYLGIRKNMA